MATTTQAGNQRSDWQRLRQEREELNATRSRFASANTILTVAVLAMAGLWIAGAVKWARATAPGPLFKARLMTGIGLGVWLGAGAARKFILGPMHKDIRAQMQSWDARYEAWSRA
jgi:hypothetical protein